MSARPQRELRELTRYRTTLVRERGAEINRLQKTLESANIKLTAVTTNVLGGSSRQVLEQLIAGATDSAALAELARGRLRTKRPQLQQALTGQIGPHQRFLLARQLAHIDALERLIGEVRAEIAERLQESTRLPAAAPTGRSRNAPPAPSATAEILQRLQTIPGVSRRATEILVAEIGVDSKRSPAPSGDSAAGLPQERQRATTAA